MPDDSSPYRIRLKEKDGGERELVFDRGTPAGFRFRVNQVGVVIVPLSLGDASWVHPGGHTFGHGSAALMHVDAHGLDGHLVRFVVEHQEDGKWLPYATVEAKVTGGAAEAALEAHHPVLSQHNQEPSLEEVISAAPTQLRFHAELV